MILGFLALLARISGSPGLTPALLIAWVIFLDHMTRNRIRNKEKWLRREKIRILEESESDGTGPPEGGGPARE